MTFAIIAFIILLRGDPYRCENIISIFNQFNGERAYKHVINQVNLGARVPGSQAHIMTREYIMNEIDRVDLWEVEIQNGINKGKEIFNIVSCLPSCRTIRRPWIIMGAHYDSRIHADRDTELSKRTSSVLGANDGASGVAILIELARVLPQDINGSIWMVFFDAEDNGNIEGWEWIMGSTYFVENLTTKPDLAVIVDMVGDIDLNIYKEYHSDAKLSDEIWDIADKLGYTEYFIPMLKHRIIDDHLPFLEKGIPAVDIIDFDYPYWHTTSDTIDKVSARSLSIVGDTLLTWLLEKYP